MDKKINEQLDYLEELLRKVNSTLSPYTIHDELAWLLNDRNKQHIFEKHPQCWLPVRIGQDVPFFPVCNRTGAYEPAIIHFSLRMARKLCKRTEVDQEHLATIISKLETLHRKFSQDIPKPSNMAYKKGLTTRMFNNIKQYLNK